MHAEAQEGLSAVYFLDFPVRNVRAELQGEVVRGVSGDKNSPAARGNTPFDQQRNIAMKLLVHLLTVHDGNFDAVLKLDTGDHA